jgi:large subunit ribosomal protein L29
VKGEVLASKLREESDSELNTRYHELKKKIFETRGLMAMKAEKANPNTVRAAKKEIARIKTVLRQRH